MSENQHIEFGIHRLMKKDAFLAVFLLTFINAIIFIYYQTSANNQVQDPEKSKEELSIFSKRVPGITEFMHIINLHGQFSLINSPEFRNAVKDLPFNNENFTSINDGIIYQNN